MISLQLESRHKEFFGVLCLHDYFSDNVCREIEFEPTPETAVMLKNYQLIFKPASFGFIVLYTPNSSEERLRTMPPKTRFSFVMRLRNNKFMNYTQIKFWPEGGTFHYSNLSGAQEEIDFAAPTDVYYYFKGLKVGDLKKKLLHLPEHEYLFRRQPRFNVGLDTNGKGDKGVSYDSIVIKDEAGNSEIQPGKSYKRRYRDAQRDMFRRHLDHRTRSLSKDLSPSEKEKRVIEISDALEKELSAMESVDHSIDLRHAPPGKYSVQMGNNPPFDIYTTEFPDLPAFGMLDIHVDAPTNALLDRNAGNTEEIINPQLFTIHYAARSTYWRYIFVNYEYSKVTPKEVRDENQVLEFTEPEEGVLENVGTTVHYAQSLNPIPLKDQPQHILFLSRMNGKRPMKEVRVPTPSGTEVVRPRRLPGDTEEKIYSEIYVYL